MQFGEASAWQKSGNPGYLLDKPLLIGQQASATSPISVYASGYRLRGASTTGAC